ncbi:MAG: hypothetical protein WCJ62_07495 [Flavobacterium sp.]
MTTTNETKKAPMTLFGKQIRHNPKAHELSIAIAMAGVQINIPTADIVLQVFTKMQEMGGKFDLSTACTIKESVLEEYDNIEKEYIEEKHREKKTKKTKHGITKR